MVVFPHTGMLGPHWMILPRICAVLNVPVLGAVPAVIVAVWVGELAGGAIPLMVILVLLSTVTLPTVIGLPSAAMIVTAVTGQPFLADEAAVMKPVPVMVTGLPYVSPANQVLGFTEAMVGMGQTIWTGNVTVQTT
jgi:hypothetical protein